MITALTSRLTNFTVKAIGNDGDLSEASNRVTNNQTNSSKITTVHKLHHHQHFFIDRFNR
jgi:hypothetical protein